LYLAQLSKHASKDDVVEFDISMVWPAGAMIPVLQSWRKEVDVLAAKEVYVLLLIFGQPAGSTTQFVWFGTATETVIVGWTARLLERLHGGVS
jgi:hypothetical protein